MSNRSINVPAAELADLCRRWRIAELAVFGSVASDLAQPDSDIDLLVRFASGEEWSTLDLARLVIEFESLFGRPVDLVEERNLANPYRRQAILTDRRVLYAA